MDLFAQVLAAGRPADSNLFYTVFSALDVHGANDGFVDDILYIVGDDERVYVRRRPGRGEALNLEGISVDWEASFYMSAVCQLPFVFQALVTSSVGVQKLRRHYRVFAAPARIRCPKGVRECDVECVYPDVVLGIQDDEECLPMNSGDGLTVRLATGSVVLNELHLPFDRVKVEYERTYQVMRRQDPLGAHMEYLPVALGPWEIGVRSLFPGCRIGVRSAIYSLLRFRSASQHANLFVKPPLVRLNYQDIVALIRESVC